MFWNAPHNCLLSTSSSLTPDISFYASHEKRVPPSTSCLSIHRRGLLRGKPLSTLSFALAVTFRVAGPKGFVRRFPGSLTGSSSLAPKALLFRACKLSGTCTPSKEAALGDPAWTLHLQTSKPYMSPSAALNFARDTRRDPRRTLNPDPKHLQP